MLPKIVSSLVVIVVLVGIANGFHLEREQPYRISSVADNTYLRVVEEGQLCKPLSKVITDSTTDSYWSPKWLGNEPTEFGVNFDTDTRKIHNEITFQNFPPNCYPMYNAWSVQQVYHGLYGMTLKNLEAGDLCLTNNGAGQPVTFQTCVTSALNQIWKFERMPSE